MTWKDTTLGRLVFYILSFFLLFPFFNLFFNWSWLQDQTNQAGARRSPNVQASLLRVSDEKIKEMKDQVIRAQAYLNFAPPGSNSHLVKELKLRIKEVERAVGAATKDSDLSRRYIIT